MEINYEYYKVFYYVAKYGKISAAAEKLFISQPAITQTIKKLEGYIDIYLPDLKYYSDEIAFKYSGIKNYFAILKSKNRIYFKKNYF